MSPAASARGFAKVSSSARKESEIMGNPGSKVSGDRFAERRAHAGVEFLAGFRRGEEVFGEFDFSGLEEGDDEGAAKAEVAHLVAFGNSLAGLISLDDAADIRGTDGEEEHFA